MPEQPLPVYQIRDFHQPQPEGSGFYLNTLSGHLHGHSFIEKPHRHDFYIFLFITNGSGTHTIDFKAHPVTAGSVFFLSPGQVHAWELSPETEGYILFFSPEFYLQGQPQHKLQQFPFYGAWLKEPRLQLAEREGATVMELIRGMAEEITYRQWKYEEVVRDYLDILFIQITRPYRKTYKTEVFTGGALTDLQQFLNLVDLHYKEHQPVSFFADQLHLTPKHLNEICRQALGKTTTELIQERVVLEARRLLLHSGLTITQVAAELGYFDNSYFARFFKKHTGQTPDQFRQSQQ